MPEPAATSPSDAAPEGVPGGSSATPPPPIGKPWAGWAPYARNLSWLVVDALWRYRWRVGLMTALGVAGSSLQLLGLSLIVRYGRAMESGSTVRVLGRSYLARESWEVLALTACAIGGLLSLSALLHYLASALSVRLDRRHQEFGTRRALTLMSRSWALWLPSTPIPGGGAAARHVALRDARACGRALWVLSNGVTSVASSVIGFVMLFSLDVQATLAVLALGLGFLATLAAIGRRGARMSRAMEEAAPAVSTALRRAHQRAKAAHPGDAAAAAQDELSPELLDFTRSYEGRMTALAKGQAASMVFSAASMTALLVVMAPRVLAQHQWGLLIAYLLALRYVLAHVTDVARRATGINLFYPQIKRYAMFLSVAQEEDRLPPPSPLAFHAVRLIAKPRPQHAVEGSLPRWQAQGPTRIAVLAPFALDREGVARLIESVVPGFEHRVVALRGASVPSLELLGPPLAPPPEGEGPWWPSDRPWVLIEAQTLLALDPAHRAALLDRHPDRSWLIRYPPALAASCGQFHESIAWVYDAAHLRGVGPCAWAAGLSPTLIPHAPPPSTATPDDDGEAEVALLDG